MNTERMSSDADPRSGLFFWPMCPLRLVGDFHHPATDSPCIYFIRSFIDEHTAFYFLRRLLYILRYSPIMLIGTQPYWDQSSNEKGAHRCFHVEAKASNLVCLPNPGIDSL